jgi:hypothetical protein
MGFGIALLGPEPGKDEIRRFFGEANCRLPLDVSGARSLHISDIR